MPRRWRLFLAIDQAVTGREHRERPLQRLHTHFLVIGAVGKGAGEKMKVCEALELGLGPPSLGAPIHPSLHNQRQETNTGKNG